jgi:hypothetical protein
LNIQRLFGVKGVADPLDPAIARQMSAELGRALGKLVYPASITAAEGVVYCLARRGIEKFLCLACNPDKPCPAWFDFEGEHTKQTIFGFRPMLRTCARTHHNAQGLRAHLPFTAPRVMGVGRAIGTGDRLGIATPGHIRAVRGTGVKVFLPQQSIREMTRTRRTAEQVVDDVTWGVLQEGFRDGFGSDADHLKTIGDIDACLAAGFTMFTIDPGEHVDNAADTAPADVLAQKFEALPWRDLETSAADWRRNYIGQRIEIGPGFALSFDEPSLLRAAVKYGRPLAHTVRMYRHLAAKAGHRPFELEVSVDETESVTTPLEHYFVASELRRLGVQWVSLAPRFVGRFEKGVDYLGDLREFEEKFIQHVAIARCFGPYKICLHSGSDKFSVYPIAARHAGELVHVKTAGTSYLNALQAIARVEPDLFREILAFAFERYNEDKASYHVSAVLGKVPRPDQLQDSQLDGLFDLFDARQLLHVTFGSVLTWQNPDGSHRFRDRFMRTLRENEGVYYEVLQGHIGRHVAPFRVT